MSGKLNGVVIQVYREKIPGKNKAEKLANVSKEMDLWKSLGVTGVAWHGFIGDLTVAVFTELTNLCTGKGMASYAAFGINSLDPGTKGREIAKLTHVPNCAGIIFDMEAAWEDEKEDKEKAKFLGDAFLANALPGILVIDQPWPIPDVHWSKFPWEETAAYVSIRAPQIYCNNWRKQWGKDAYEKFMEWHLKSWAKLEARLGPKGLSRPKIPTFQGYFWDFPDAVKAVTSFDDMIVWSEWKPEKEFLVALEAKKKLASLGFTGHEAVKQFQQSVGLANDNACGKMTMDKLGILMP